MVVSTCTKRRHTAAHWLAQVAKHNFMDKVWLEDSLGCILHFGTMIAVDDPVTEGPSIESKEIGRSQGMYVNSQLDGKGLHMVFSVIFTDGEFKGSSLEIQGADIFSMKDREFGIVSGTGYFRFVKGYGIMETEFMDIANLRAVLKLNVTVKDF
ncbi:dirigent protein 11-like [Corylus avellana]|uniref:dirigent protein 11-like n=1 Tax=Corylus avellana TaxID=13451 RepID=UPI001E1EC81A|nr:dirigent protein 11-like [Corylus avellana]